VAQIDDLRQDPVGTINDWFAPRAFGMEPRRVPVAVRALTWMFATSRHSSTFRNAAQRVFGLR
jgi:hypothetical protein